MAKAKKAVEPEALTVAAHIEITALDPAELDGLKDDMAKIAKKYGARTVTVSDHIGTYDLGKPAIVKMRGLDGEPVEVHNPDHLTEFPEIKRVADDPDPDEIAKAMAHRQADERKATEEGD